MRVDIFGCLVGYHFLYLDLVRTMTLDGVANLGKLSPLLLGINAALHGQQLLTD